MSRLPESAGKQPEPAVPTPSRNPPRRKTPSLHEPVQGRARGGQGAPMAAALLLSLLASAPAAGQTRPEPWPVAGRQGIILQVIVPAAHARDMGAYRQQIETLCAGRETCFVNFFTNSTSAELATPLPDAITQEATVVLRRSGKNGVEGFRWSCRLAMPEPGCF